MCTWPRSDAEIRNVQPLESVSPLILNPHLNPKKPVPIELLNKASQSLHAALLSCDELKCMAVMFGKGVIQHLGGIMCVLQLKGVLMAIYFGADHVVWAGQAGLVSNKQLLER